MRSGREVCRSCGAELVEGAAHCDQCGLPVDGPAGDPGAVGGGEGGNATPLCPRCGRPTEKAVAAAERLANFAATEDAGAEAPEQDAAREERAGWLARPEEPRAFSLFAWLFMLLIPFLNVLSLFIAPFTLGLRLFMGVVGLVYVGVVIWYAAGTFVDPFAAKDAAMMTGFTTFALYLVALAHSWRVERRDVKRRRLPAWRRGVERWEHLEYCDACGTVRFDDQETAPVPVEQARELLGAAAWEERADARTPLWLWMVLAAMAVGGGRIAVSMGREANAEPEPLAPASPGMWEDIETDPVRLDSAGPQEPGTSDPSALDEPLLGPGAVPPDTIGV